MSSVTAAIKTEKFKTLPVLAEAAIRELAPQVYTKQAYTSTSKKYTFIPTHQIIKDMKELGWQVCSAQSMKSTDKIQQQYGKHLIKFFNPNIFIEGPNNTVEAYPQIVVMNNHRGWGKFKFEIGVFRLVCSNGMVVKDKDMGSFVMRHLGYSFDELKVLVNQAVEALPTIVTKINKFSERVMTHAEQAAFATAALKVRLGEDRVCTDQEIRQVLQSTRKEDDGSSLWRVFNRVQEHLLNGGFETTTTAGTFRKVRKISNMLKNVELNQQLWALTSQYS